MWSLAAAGADRTIARAATSRVVAGGGLCSHCSAAVKGVADAAVTCSMATRPCAVLADLKILAALRGPGMASLRRPTTMRQVSALTAPKKACFFAGTALMRVLRPLGSGYLSRVFSALITARSAGQSFLLTISSSEAWSHQNVMRLAYRFGWLPVGLCPCAGQI